MSRIPSADGVSASFDYISEQLSRRKTFALKERFLTNEFLRLEFAACSHPDDADDFYAVFSALFSQISLAPVGNANPSLFEVYCDDVIKYIKEKLGGVEPGYLYHAANDALVLFYKAYVDVQQRKEKILQYHAASYEALVDAIYEDYKDKLPVYLLKMNYEITASGLIKPECDRLRRTTYITNLSEAPVFGPALAKFGTFVYQQSKQTSLVKMNESVLLEITANSYAGLFIPVQDQRLVYSMNSDKLQLLLKSTWNCSAKTLPLAGSQNGRNHLVFPLPYSNDEGGFLLS